MVSIDWHWPALAELREASSRPWMTSHPFSGYLGATRAHRCSWLNLELMFWLVLVGARSEEPALMTVIVSVSLSAKRSWEAGQVKVVEPHFLAISVEVRTLTPQRMSMEWRGIPWPCCFRFFGFSVGLAFARQHVAEQIFLYLYITVHKTWRKQSWRRIFFSHLYNYKSICFFVFCCGILQNQIRSDLFHVWISLPRVQVLTISTCPSLPFSSWISGTHPKKAIHGNQKSTEIHNPWGNRTHPILT